MSAVYLLVDVPGVDEKYLVFPRCLIFGLIQKREEAGQGHGIEEIRPDGNHDVYDF